MAKNQLSKFPPQEFTRASFFQNFLLEIPKKEKEGNDKDYSTQLIQWKMWNIEKSTDPKVCSGKIRRLDR